MTQTEQVNACGSQLPEDLRRQVHELVESNRDRCLWFLRKDYYPENTASALRALAYIQQRGDLKAFQRAGELIQCLSLPTNELSANS